MAPRRVSVGHSGSSRTGIARLLSAWLPAAGLVTAALSLIQAIGPLRYGQWVQSESVVAGLWIGGAVAAIGLALAARINARRIGGILAEPVVAAPLLLAVWTGLMSPLHPLPMLSWFGFPDLGEGVLWWLAFACLTAAGVHVRAAPALPWAVCIVVVVSVSAYAVATVGFGHGSAYAPYWFSDYLAFPACFIMATILGLGGRRGWRWGLATLILTGVLLWMSWNQTAWLSGVLMLLIAGLVWLVQRRYPAGLAGGRVTARRLAILTVIGLPVAVTGGVLLTGDYLQVETNWDRARLLELVSVGLSDQPARLVIGMGWGQVSDLLIRHVLLDGVTLTAAGDWAPNWAAVHWRHWHSHNHYADALLAGGVPGAMLMLWVAVAPVARAPRRLLVPAVLGCGLFAATAAAWFQLPGTLAVMAAGYAGLAGWRRPAPGRWHRWLAPVGGRADLVWSLAAGVLLSGAATQIELAARAGPLFDDPQAHLPVDPQTCPGLVADYGRGGVHLSDQLTNQVDLLLKAWRPARPLPGHPPPLPTEEDRSNAATAMLTLQPLLCAAAHWRDGGVSLRLPIAVLQVRTEVAFTTVPPGLRAAHDAITAGWEDDLDAFLALAPRRFDLTAPYFAWRIGRDEEATALAFAERRLAADPADPVALWYAGVIRIGRADQAALGLRNMARALDLGVERLVLIPEAITAQVRRAVGP